MAHVALRLVAAEMEIAMSGHAVIAQTGEHRQQRDRIGPAAESHDDPVAAVEQRMSPDGIGNSVSKSRFVVLTFHSKGEFTIFSGEAQTATPRTVSAF